MQGMAPRETLEATIEILFSIANAYEEVLQPGLQESKAEALETIRDWRVARPSSTSGVVYEDDKCKIW